MTPEERPLTGEDLRLIETLCRQASPLPWATEPFGVGTGYLRYPYCDDGGNIIGSLICVWADGEVVDSPVAAAITRGAAKDGPSARAEEEQARRDANFIAAASLYLPQLLAEVKRLRALLGLRYDLANAAAEYGYHTDTTKECRRAHDLVETLLERMDPGGKG